MTISLVQAVSEEELLDQVTPGDWCCRLVLPTGAADWCCRLVLPTGAADWYCRLVLPTGAADWWVGWGS